MLQIEKDMIHDFYHNTREEIKELEADIRNFDTRMEDSEGRHNTEVVSYLQKVSHHEYEHTEALNFVKGEANDFMRQEFSNHTQNETHNRQEKKTMKDDYSRENMSSIADVEQEEKDLESKLRDTRVELEANKKELLMKYERKMEDLDRELQLRMKVEVHEIEERKNQHINDLMINHEQAFREMKEYYNDITRENLEIIKLLKEKYKDIKGQIAQNESTVLELKKSVKDMLAPLAKSKDELHDLKKSVATFDKDVMGYHNAQGSLRDLKARTKKIQNDRATLNDKFKKIDGEKNEMYRKFEVAINQLQQRADYKNEQLEDKLGVFMTELEKKELTLRELVQRSGLDQPTVDNICKNMEEAIEAKNSILRNLKYSLAHATKAYNDAIRVYEAKLVEFGIPAEELGLEPLVTNTSTMPAGLVSA